MSAVGGVEKLAQTLEINKQLTKLPNVQLMDRRYTPIDRHQELGRWKVIVNELKQRDLPITGFIPPSEVEQMANVTLDEKKREQLLQEIATLFTRERVGMPLTSVGSAWAMRRDRVNLVRARTDEDTLAMDIVPTR